MHALDAVHLANGLSGLAFAALGVWVLSVGARSATNAAFGAYALTWAVIVLISNFVLEVGHASASVQSARLTLSLVLLGALAVLVARHPAPLGRADLPRVALAIALALPSAWGVDALSSPVSVPIEGAAAVIADVEKAIFDVGLWALLLLLALRWPTLDASGRRAVALVSSALVLWPAYSLGEVILTRPFAQTAVDVFAPLALVVIWLANARHADARSARAVAWLGLASALGAMLERTVFPAAPDLWGFGVTRLFGVALLGYAIVRHQLFGIDVKVRWTISRGTLATAFIAVFFVASEGAQQFFGDTFDSTYLGIAAAGALVFAMAPLLRAAEKLAEKAVPSPAPDDARASHEDAFRAAVRLALRAGMTRREEFELARIAEAHAIPPVRALEIRDEVERGDARETT